jgi:hypothetical protein
MPPFSITPSAPTRHRETHSRYFPTAASKITVVGIPASQKIFAAENLWMKEYGISNYDGGFVTLYYTILWSMNEK